jgi:hypothetical protein
MASVEGRFCNRDRHAGTVQPKTSPAISHAAKEQDGAPHTCCSCCSCRAACPAPAAAPAPYLACCSCSPLDCWPGAGCGAAIRPCPCPGPAASSCTSRSLVQQQDNEWRGVSSFGCMLPALACRTSLAPCSLYVCSMHTQDGVQPRWMYRVASSRVSSPHAEAQSLWNMHGGHGSPLFSMSYLLGCQTASQTTLVQSLAGSTVPASVACHGRPCHTQFSQQAHSRRAHLLQLPHLTMTDWPLEWDGMTTCSTSTVSSSWFRLATAAASHPAAGSQEFKRSCCQSSAANACCTAALQLIAVHQSNQSDYSSPLTAAWCQ